MRTSEHSLDDDSVVANDILVIEKSDLVGSLHLPPSKSHSMRWLTLASMDSTVTKIEMSEIGEDVSALLDCLKSMGIEWNGKEMRGGDLCEPEGVLNCQNSGTAFRFIMAQAATCGFPVVLDGDASLRARSSLQLLKSLGIPFQLESENHAPILLNGPFSKDEVSVDISESSQFLSAILLMTPRTNGFSLSKIGEGVSRRHSELTWDLCKLTGAKEWGEPWDVRCPDVKVPSDASMAAFARLAGLQIENLPDESDNIGHDLDCLDLRDSNDLISPMAAWLAMGEGGTITGASHAALKESNRITRTVELLAAFGMVANATSDGLHVPGNQIPKTPDSLVRTHGDHRLQMTAILLASKCGAAIEGSSLHKVAWPTYLQQLENCGLNIKR